MRAASLFYDNSYGLFVEHSSSANDFAHPIIIGGRTDAHALRCAGVYEVECLLFCVYIRYDTYMVHSCTFLAMTAKEHEVAGQKLSDVIYDLAFTELLL